MIQMLDSELGFRTWPGGQSLGTAGPAGHAPGTSLPRSRSLSKACVSGGPWQQHASALRARRASTLALAPRGWGLWARGFHTSPALLAAWAPRLEVLMQPSWEGGRGTCRHAGLLSRGVTPCELLAALRGEVQGQGKKGLRWSSGNRQEIRFMQLKQLFIKNFKASRSALWMPSGLEKKQMAQAYVLREGPLFGFCLSLPPPYLVGWGTPGQSAGTARGLLEGCEEWACVGSTRLFSARGHQGLTVEFATELLEHGKG